ncbi:MAG: GNAT family N-acetyltransferase [Anaerolineae bacterium]|jgi:RimJ/RimL family protein N-acetyltransferase|nr:GNAT family N-acetyltransferase [Anaerolineae bacterium]
MKPEDYERWLKLLDIPTKFETDRLILRLLEESDAEELYERMENSREHLSKFLRWAVDRFPTVEDTVAEIRRLRARFFAREDLHYHLFEKSSGKMIGSTGGYCTFPRTPTWDVGYSLFEPFLGKGYATEAVKAVIQLMCEELKAKRIELIINAENEASQRLAKRLGFTHEVTQREHEWNVAHTKLVDIQIHGLTLPEYEANKAFYQVLVKEEGE